MQLNKEGLRLIKSKVVKIVIIILSIPVVIGVILGGMFTFYYVNAKLDSPPKNQEVEVRPLTEQEQSFVGVWKADDGSLIAVRARGGYGAEEFALDAIYDEIIDSEGNRGWSKITRDTDITLEQEGELLVISDKFPCPDMNHPDDSTRWVETEERLEYNAQTDTLTHISRHQDYNETKVFHRTDRDPTDKSIDWDWYYDIHPNRKP